LGYTKEITQSVKDDEKRESNPQMFQLVSYRYVYTLGMNYLLLGHQIGIAKISNLFGLSNGPILV